VLGVGHAAFSVIFVNHVLLRQLKMQILSATVFCREDGLIMLENVVTVFRVWLGLLVFALA
jgi:hypothetical protein